MGKGYRTASKAAYGLTGLLMMPIYDMIREERKEETKRYNKRLKEISLLLEAEAASPRRFEVHQPYDPIVHYHPFW